MKVNLSLVFFLILGLSDGRPWVGENAELRANILRELGVEENISPVALKGNISRAEYASAYEKYMENVRQRKGIHLQRKNNLNALTRRHTLFDHGTDNGDSVTFHFPLPLPDHPEGVVRVKRAILTLPPTCVPLTLGNSSLLSNASEWDVSRPLAAQLLSSPSFGLTATCSPNLPLAERRGKLEAILSQKRRFRRSSSLHNLKGRNKKGRECGKQKGGRTCCRKSLPIKFSDLGISDLIIEPQQFDAHVCVGRCKDQQRAPFFSTHSLFQLMVHAKKGKKGAPPPCCTPTKLTELDVIHLDPTGSKLEVTVLRDAIVSECGCS